MADQLFPTDAARRRYPSPMGDLAALVAEPGNMSGSAVTTLLMVPGYTGSKEDFAPLLDPLSAAGYRAVAIDQPGQFESPGVDDESGYTVDALGAVVAARVEALAADGPVVLLGHSFGGLVARAAVTNGAPVAGLVLLCSGPGALPDGPRRTALVTGAPLMRTHGAAHVYDAGEANPMGRTFTSALDEFRRRRFVASNGLLGMGTALLNEPDRISELAAVLDRTAIPVAVIAGEADDAWSLPSQADMAQRLGTRLRLIPGAAHSPAIEAPQLLLAELLSSLAAWTA